MPLNRPDCFSYASVAAATEAQSSTFTDFVKTPVGLQLMKTYLDGNPFLVLEERWLKICGDDPGELETWASLMGHIHTYLCKLRVQVALWGKETFDPISAGHTLSHLNAHRVTIEQLLELNEPR